MRQVDGTNSTTGTTDTQVIVPPTGGDRVDLHEVVICNTSAVATTIALKCGGATRQVLPCPVGGAVVAWRHGLRGDRNAGWQFAAANAASTITVSVAGVRKRETED
jgi:hypothetical protein